MKNCKHSLWNYYLKSGLPRLSRASDDLFGYRLSLNKSFDSYEANINYLVNISDDSEDMYGVMFKMDYVLNEE
jgi:hypothetical protein